VQVLRLKKVRHMKTMEKVFDVLKPGTGPLL
jgi:hypothetical protein